MNIERIGVLCLLALLASCQKESKDLQNVSDHFYVKTDGANIPVEINGNLNSKIVVVLLHGGPGGDDVTYNEGIKAFSDSMEKEFAMVYYDQRSSGMSSGKFRKITYLNVHQYVTDLNRVILAVKSRYGNDNKIVLMGHSWGGTLGTAYLLEPSYQNDISAWIEVDGAHNFNATGYVIDRFKQIGTQMNKSGYSTAFWTEVIDFCNSMDSSSANDVSKLNSYGFKAEQHLADDGFLAGTDIYKDIRKMKFHSQYNGTTAQTNLFFTSSGFGLFNEVSNINYTPQLHNIKIPSLFMWGRYDLVVPATLGEQALKKSGAANHQAELMIFEHSGHSPMVNETAVFTRSLVQWIHKTL